MCVVSSCLSPRALSGTSGRFPRACIAATVAAGGVVRAHAAFATVATGAATHNAPELRWLALACVSADASSRPAKNLAGVHQIVRIECVLDGAHRVDRDIAVFLKQKIHLVQTDAVLAGARAVHA